MANNSHLRSGIIPKTSRNGLVFEHGIGVHQQPHPNHLNSSYISKKSDEVLTKNEILTRRSIINSIWTLTETQQSWLHVRSMRATSLTKFISMISTDHDYLDHIRSHRINDTSYDYRVSYVNGSTSWVERLVEIGHGETPCIISFRASKMYETYTALVLLDKEGSLKDIVKRMKWL